MEKTTQRFQRIASTRADLNAEGLNAQTVNDPLTMYVGAASQHVLRTSFGPEQEAKNFDTQVTAFWSHLIQRDVTSPLFFSPPNLDDLAGALQFSDMQRPHGVLGNWYNPTLMATTRALRQKHTKETSLHHPQKPPQATS